MKKTMISDAELKAILLALAEAGAPKPKRGTVLGDALVRFTTPDCGDAATCGPLAAHSTTVRPFDVTVTVTRTDCGTFQVAAINEEQAEEIVRDSVTGLDLYGPCTQYVKTEYGVKEFYVDFGDIGDTDVEIEAVKPPDADDCMLDLTEAEGT